jgi:hypothetical protein
MSGISASIVEWGFIGARSGSEARVGTVSHVGSLILRHPRAEKLMSGISVPIVVAGCCRGDPCGLPLGRGRVEEGGEEKVYFK